jgi:ABC-2 type transport system permease protein
MSGGAPGPVGLYRRYLLVCLRSQLQYRASVIMQAVGFLLVNVLEFVAIWALFDRFGNLRGWRLPEVGLLYGTIELVYALTVTFFRGVDGIPTLIASGGLDGLLIRPRSTVLQLMGREVALKNLGRVAQGVAVLIWAGIAVRAAWTIAKLLLLLGAIAGGVCLFLGVLLVQGTVAVWTIEPLEIMNAFTDGGANVAQYPMSIYRSWFRAFFTFVIPVGCISYLPALAILERTAPYGIPPLLAWSSPLAGVLFLVLAVRLWRLGVRRYVSAGT